MRFSLNTILLALVSSSVIMTDVMAIPLTRVSHSPTRQPPRKLARRQDAQNSTIVADELNTIVASVKGVAILAENIANIVVNIATELGIDTDDSDSGADGQDGGDSSGADDSGSTDTSGSGDSGDSGASDGSDGASGSASNQRRDDADDAFEAACDAQLERCAEELAQLFGGI